MSAPANPGPDVTATASRSRAVAVSDAPGRSFRAWPYWRVCPLMKPWRGRARITTGAQSKRRGKSAGSGAFRPARNRARGRCACAPVRSPRVTPSPPPPAGGDNSFPTSGAPPDRPAQGAMAGGQVQVRQLGVAEHERGDHGHAEAERHRYRQCHVRQYLSLRYLWTYPRRDQDRRGEIRRTPWDS